MRPLLCLCWLPEDSKCSWLIGGSDQTLASLRCPLHLKLHVKDAPPLAVAAQRRHHLQTVVGVGGCVWNARNGMLRRNAGTTEQRFWRMTAAAARASRLPAAPHAPPPTVSNCLPRASNMTRCRGGCERGNRLQQRRRQQQLWRQLQRRRQSSGSIGGEGAAGKAGHWLTGATQPMTEKLNSCSRHAVVPPASPPVLPLFPLPADLPACEASRGGGRAGDECKRHEMGARAQNTPQQHARTPVHAQPAYHPSLPLSHQFL